MIHNLRATKKKTTKKSKTERLFLFVFNAFCSYNFVALNPSSDYFA